MTDTIPCPVPSCGGQAKHAKGGIRCLETGIFMTPTDVDRAIEAAALAAAIKNRPAGQSVDDVLREVT
jgi:hypothetical protein